MADLQGMDFILEGLVVSLVIIVFLPVAAVIGVAVVLATVWTEPGRTRCDYPSCGRCHFNLSGSLGKTDTCPECGTSIGVAGVCPIRSGRRASSLPAGIIIALAGAIALWLLVFIG
jgi:hypothetical protein